MARDFGTTATGKPFCEERVAAVWEKARPALVQDADEYRFDDENRLIRFGDYGKLTETGWEVDHIMPVALGGSDHMRNLRPLHWEANRKKGDRQPERPMARTGKASRITI